MIRRIAIAAALIATGTAWTAAAPSEAEIRALLVAGQTSEAEAAARAAIAELEGAPDAELAEALDVLVELLITGGRAAEPETRELAERAVTLRRAESGPTAALAASLARAAAVRRAQGDLPGAAELYAAALDVLEPQAQPADPELGRCARGLAEAAAAIGDHQTARRAYQLLLDQEIAAHGPGSTEAAKATVELARSTGDAGEIEAAAMLFGQALEVLERTLGPADLEVGAALNGLANVMRKQGDYAEARRLLERSLAITEGQLGPDDPEVAGVLNNLGNVQVGLGDLEAARQTYQRVLAIWEAAQGPDSPNVGKVLSNLGVVELNLGDPAAAIPLLERSVTIREQAFGAEAPVLGIPLINLGDALLQHGDLERAQATLERAAEILERNQGDSTYVAEAINNLGLLLLERGQGDEAAHAFDRARAVVEHSAGHTHPRTAIVIANQARATAFRDQPDTALGLALESERIAREHLCLTSAVLSEREALGYAHQQRESLDLALSIAVGPQLDDPTLLAAAWDALIRSRCMVLEEMALRRALLAGVPEAAPLIEARSEAAGRLSDLLTSARSSDSDAEIAAARRELELAERALGQARASIERDQIRRRLGLEEVSSTLAADACLVAYVRFDRSFYSDPLRRGGDFERWYLAFVRGPSGRLAMLPLADAPAVEGLVRSWRAAAGRPADGGELARAAGERLRATVWDPAVASCGDASRVFVVPDGELGLVNFAALPAGANSFLVEQGPLLVVIDQEQDLVPDPLTSPALGACLLALGAPDFDAAPGAARDGEPFSADLSLGSTLAEPRGQAGPRFAPLPGTAAEATEVAAAWVGAAETNTALVLAGDEASEHAFKSLAPGHRVLHLATHGIFLSPDALLHAAGERGVGSLVAAGSDGGEPTAGSELRLSGLALAGANRRGAAAAEDGILTAEEIAGLDLSGVEWAVLSACDSGVGEVSSQEGVFGLRRAFRIAGARTVVMSLWSVDDEAAREWMIALYRARLVEGLPTAEAVRRASLEVLAARRQRGASVHPASWAAFVASGDWR